MRRGVRSSRPARDPRRDVKAPAQLEREIRDAAALAVRREEMSEASDVDRLASEMAKMRPYRGWRFSYEYPGLFRYSHPGVPYSVFFTPDWEVVEAVPVEVSSDDGSSLPGYDLVLPFPGSGRTGHKLFGLIKPTLDSLTTRFLDRGRGEA